MPGDHAKHDHSAPAGPAGHGGARAPPSRATPPGLVHHPFQDPGTVGKVFDASDVLLGSRTITGLAANTNWIGSTTVTIPAATTVPDAHYPAIRHALGTFFWLAGLPEQPHKELLQPGERLGAVGG